MDWQSSVAGMYQPNDNNDDEDMQEEDNEDFYGNAFGNTDDAQPGAPEHEQEQEQEHDVGAGIHLVRIN